MSYYPGENRGGGRRVIIMIVIVIAAAVVGGIIWGTANRVSKNSSETAKTEESATPAATKAAEEKSAETQTVNNDFSYSGSYDSMADMIEYAKGAVVNVLNYQSSASTSSSGTGFVPNEDTEAEEESPAGFGSGCVISEDGYILTNSHVIEDATRLEVLTVDGKTYEAEVIGSDAKTDVALLKIDATGLTALKIGDSSSLRMGDTAVAIGYLEIGVPSATAGIISAESKRVYINNWPCLMLQTDAAINSGNSGGALLNANGELIGINTMKKNYTGYSEDGQLMNADNIGYAIPSAEFQKAMSDLTEYGYVRRPTIGITGTSVTETQAAMNDLVAGVMIASVQENSAAAEAGLQENDIIIKLEDTEVTEIADINDVLYEHAVGDTVTVMIWRSGETLELSLTLKAPEA